LLANMRAISRHGMAALARTCDMQRLRPAPLHKLLLTAEPYGTLSPAPFPAGPVLAMRAWLASVACLLAQAPQLALVDLHIIDKNAARQATAQCAAARRKRQKRNMWFDSPFMLDEDALLALSQCDRLTWLGLKSYHGTCKPLLSQLPQLGPLWLPRHMRSSQ
jgi:hypothetical protein